MKESLLPLAEEILAEGDDDWVMVDSLIGTAEEFAGALGEDFRSVATELLRALLSEGLMEIGDLGETGFEAWTCSVEESVERFREGAEACAWNPMGGLWWLANTPEGMEWLRRRRKGAGEE